jgi:hypothetical protein
MVIALSALNLGCSSSTPQIAGQSPAVRVAPSVGRRSFTLRPKVRKAVQEFIASTAASATSVVRSLHPVIDKALPQIVSAARRVIVSLLRAVRP